MRELLELINIINQQYEIVCKKWEDDPGYIPIHMKKNRVEDFYKDDNLLQHVFNYRQFIIDNISELFDEIQNFGFKNRVNSRVKAINSIQFKIQNYEQKHENGKIAIKKCFNDILGIRIILEEEIDYDETIDVLKKYYPNLKCIKSIRGEYEAIHIYFGDKSNFRFQWELQVWEKSKEKTNIASHAEYKQDYTKWEQENSI